MDDMTAFERQVASEMHRIVGPPRPVDDLAILGAIAATPSRTRRLQVMFSGVRLVVAAAFVALLGGMLLAGASPQPRPILLPGVELVTEEVEPGVFRVLSDSTGNDLERFARWDRGTTEVVAGQDGSVWIRDRQQEGEDRLLRLGDAGVVDASRLSDHVPDLSVAADGTLWALGHSTGQRAPGDGEGQLFSLSDGAWTAHAVADGRTLTGIETPEDGSIWASVAVGVGEGCPGGDAVAAGGRLAVARLVDGEWVEESIEPTGRAGDGGSLAVGPDGTALLGTTYFTSCPEGAWIGIMERGQDGWAPTFTVDAAADGVRPGIGPIAIGADGTAWAYQDLSAGDARAAAWDPRLLRRTDGAWEVLGDDESVPALIGPQEWTSRIAVSTDGRLWIALDGPWPLPWHRDRGKKSVAATLDGPCAGVLSYDGTTWSHHLAGACATDVSAAPNGDVWVTIGDIDPWLDEESQDDPERATRARPGLYVITPGAVEAAVRMGGRSALLPLARARVHAVLAR